MEEYIEYNHNPEIIIKDCPIHGYYTIKRIHKRSPKKFHNNNYFSDNEEPKIYYNESSIPILPHNINIGSYTPNTYFLQNELLPLLLIS